MFRSFLIYLTSILIVLNSSIVNAESFISGKGYCQNLVINTKDLTNTCKDSFIRVVWANDRINYMFFAKDTLLAFAGDASTESGDRSLSSVLIDLIYVNKQIINVKGKCFILGNYEVGSTISCRSNDNSRSYSALFLLLEAPTKH